MPSASTQPPCRSGVPKYCFCSCLPRALPPSPQGRPATENDSSPFHSLESRGGSESLALDFVGAGCAHGERAFRVDRSRPWRPRVHRNDRAIARQKGVSGYPADGTNQWMAVHRTDAERLIALGLEKEPAGSRLHAVAEEGIQNRDIAEAIGRAFGLQIASVAPDHMPSHFGWLGTFSVWTSRPLLGWIPVGPTPIEDLDAGAYSDSS
jgi:hypothetical protein